MGGIPVCGTNDGADLRGVEAILKIMFEQLVGARNGNGAEFVKTQHGKPELIVPFEHQHDPIPLLNAEGLKVVRATGRGLFHIEESKAALGKILGNVQHAHFFRFTVRHRVHDIESKVEFFGVFELDGSGGAVLIFRHVNELFIRAFSVVTVCFGAVHNGFCGRKFGNGFAGGVKYDGVKGAILSFHRDHAVRGAAIVIDAVAGMQNFHVTAHLHFERALDHDIALLPGVGSELDLLVLRGFVIYAAHEQGFRDPVLEGVGKVVIGHTVRLRDLLTVSYASDDIRVQHGGIPLDDIRHVYAERFRTAINEGKVQIAVAPLTDLVLLFGDTGLFRHLRRRKSFYLSEFADALRHFFDLSVQIRPFHSYSVLQFISLYFTADRFG